MADTTWTIASILTWTRQYFSDKGVENPRLDAEVLLSHILGMDRLHLYVQFDQPLEKEELTAYRELVKKRAMRIPVAYILGMKEFMGLEFQVNPAVLIPRPDTEILVETVLRFVREEDQILDVGTGSGAIIISLLQRLSQAKGIGIDLSKDALTVAAKNAKHHGVTERLELIQSDLFQQLQGQSFEVIVSNPPYIPDGEREELQAEVKQEPDMALFGGPDGLIFYRQILLKAKPFLRIGGKLIFEVGIHQARQVVKLGEEQGYVLQEIVKDYAGIERVIVLTQS